MCPTDATPADISALLNTDTDSPMREQNPDCFEKGELADNEAEASKVGDLEPDQDESTENEPMMSDTDLSDCQTGDDEPMMSDTGLDPDGDPDDEPMMSVEDPTSDGDPDLEQDQNGEQKEDTAKPTQWNLKTQHQKKHHKNLEKKSSGPELAKKPSM